MMVMPIQAFHLALLALRFNRGVDVDHILSNYGCTPYSRFSLLLVDHGDSSKVDKRCKL